MKQNFPVLELSLPAACAALAARIAPLPPEHVRLPQALGRVSAAAIPAVRPSPAFNQSARDGFAVAVQPFAADCQAAVFHVIGEVAAGCLAQQSLAPGQAVRIMTGAVVPSGCAWVLPFEVCQEQGGNVLAPLAELGRAQRHIRRQGQDIQAGQTLVSAGTRLRPDHLLLLAEDGCQQLAAHRQPRAAVICTGSELVNEGDDRLRPGQKISGNSALLAALLQELGGICVRTVIAEDQAGPTAALIREIVERDKPDLLITTGGMGPGKFDLTEQAFALLGGEPLCNRLQLRPGRATLIGLLDGLLFFGLPGPPPAVRLLFHEVVAPALRRLQGEPDGGGLIEAILDGPIAFRQNNSGNLILKGGVAWLGKDGCLRARPADTLEPVNAVLHLISGQEQERARVRLVGPLPQGLAA